MDTSLSEWSRDLRTDAVLGMKLGTVRGLGDPRGGVVRREWQ